MAVVKIGHGFVWTIPINTYSGQGVGKRGFTREDIDAHAIIHDSETRPVYASDIEPKMRKHPIAVDLRRDQTLERASRINFAKVHTVEWNVRAMDVGKIAPKSIVYFETYWKEQRDL